MQVELIEEGTTPDPVASMAIAASKCYDSEPSKGLVRRVLDMGHLSIAEHAFFHFEIKEVSRVLTHQLVRKRIGASYSQRSQRYVNEDNFDYVTPESLVNTKFAETYHYLMEDIEKFYQDMVDRGIPKEDARFVLPNATHSQIDVSYTFLSLLELSQKRLCTRAQWEIRQLVEMFRDEVQRVSPFLASYLEPQCVHKGYCPEKEPCGYFEKYKEG